MRGKGPITPLCYARGGELHRIEKVDASSSSSRYDVVLDGDGKKKRKFKYLQEPLTAGCIVNEVLMNDGPLLGREFDSLPSGPKNYTHACQQDHESVKRRKASNSALQNHPNCNMKAPVKKHGMGKGLMTVWRATNHDTRDLPVGFDFSDQETPISIIRSRKAVTVNGNPRNKLPNRKPTFQEKRKHLVQTREQGESNQYVTQNQPPIENCDLALDNSISVEGVDQISMLVDDEELERRELQEGANMLVCSNELAAYGMLGCSDVLVKFPPGAVKMKKPIHLQPWDSSPELVKKLFKVFHFIYTYAVVVDVCPFTLDEFVQAFHDKDSMLLGKIHVALLTRLLSDIEVELSNGFCPHLNKSCNFLALLHSVESQEYSLSVWKRSLNPLTWIEILRQVLVAAGFGSKQGALRRGVLGKRYEDVSKQRFDRAILTFLQHLRRCYIGDQVVLSSKQLYTRLSELLGVHDHLLLINVIVGKITTNLKYYTKCKELIDHTLTLFLEMASGSMTGKLLLKLDTVQHIILNHNREQFPFLENWECFRSRTTLYYTFGMLVFMEDSKLKFKSSMEPFLQVFGRLNSTPDALFQSDAVKYAFIGLMRDLRGITMATNSRRTYGFLFDWLYPTHMPILLKSLAHYADAPEVTTPLLKFVAELVLNKSQRLIFNSSSPNGILLFREVSKLIVAYGSRILPLPNKADMYTSKYKGISICLIILERALSGNFVNFGIFELYGDRALFDALDITIKLMLSIPLGDIFAFRKVAASYFAFLETLFNGHLSFVLNIDKTALMLIVESLELGIKDLSEKISSQCASAIDNLATFYFNNVTVGFISEFPELFSRILRTLFEVVILEDRGNQWTHSSAILSMILISKEMFANTKAQILASYPPERHQALSLCFDKLMQDVNISLDSKNRGKFSQNLTRFKSEFCVK